MNAHCAFGLTTLFQFPRTQILSWLRCGRYHTPGVPRKGRLSRPRDPRRLALILGISPVAKCRALALNN